MSDRERADFTTWAAGLRDSGFASGGDLTNADNAYQYRVSGYPEKEIPIDPKMSTHGTQLADGLRATDGMAVDAKYVRAPGCGRTFRSLDKLASADSFQTKILYKDDKDEL